MVEIQSNWIDTNSVTVFMNSVGDGNFFDYFLTDRLDGRGDLKMKVIN